MIQPNQLERSHAGLLHDFAADVRNGLGQRRKSLPCKYFYDDRGAVLFERICELDEYYPTRTEMGIMRRHAAEMADALGPNVSIIELGSGAGEKIRLLLDHLEAPAAYIPVDVARAQLASVTDGLSCEYADLRIEPLCADFTLPFSLPECTNGGRRTVYFPGSTIGNLPTGEAIELLRRMVSMVGPGGGLLIGLDLRKDPAILHAAYNDAAGVTAEFNRNILHRINRELDGTFDPGRFAHYAFYQPAHGRVELHLVSLDRQRVRAADREFAFDPGESILTEYSHKYDPQDFARLAAKCGLRLRETWTDARSWFSVHLYEADELR